MSRVLEQLRTVLEARKSADPGSSYVASLYGKGLNKILEKVGEEATETLLAAKDVEAMQSAATGSERAADSSPDSELSSARLALLHEVADLWFHTLVMLSHLDLSHEQVLEELEKRFNISGLEEKAARKN